MSHTRRWLALTACLATGLASAVTLVAAHPAGAVPAGSSYLVTVGDSYISGEAGRWAGNTNTGEAYVDAGGPSVYNDNADHTAETIPGCHRSASDEAFIGGGVIGADLACSGATTATQAYHAGSDFKPGLDFYDDGSGHLGQAKQLQTFASTHRVAVVAVSIGGNDFNFAGIVTDCVEDFLTSPTWWKNYCHDDSSVTANFTAANIATVRAHIATALINIRTAMRNAGYADASWSLLLQDYPSPLPSGSGIRYAESGFTRQSTGGCGFWNADADWANTTALPTIDSTVKAAATASGLTNVQVLEIAHAFDGRRLCEKTVNRLQDTGSAYWYQAGPDALEWFQGIRTISTLGSDYEIQESLHPDHYAQLALRNCVRQAYTGGVLRGGTCSISGAGLTANGEPVMSLH